MNSNQPNNNQPQQEEEDSGYQVYRAAWELPFEFQ